MKFLYKETASVPAGEIEIMLERLASYHERLRTIAHMGTYQEPESSLALPFDQELHKSVGRIVAEKTSNALRWIIVIGIGGSNLGAKAVYDALQGYADVLEQGRTPKMLFLDTTDSAYASYVKTLIIGHVASADEILVCVISKSGTTTETIAYAEVVVETLTHRFSAAARDRVVVITDKESELWHAAHTQGMTSLAVPHVVGGRFSVLSAVGLLPLAACGFNISALAVGAKEMRAQCLAEDMNKNPAALSASMLYVHLKHGLTIHDTFVFHPQLESLGKWYRQLLAESIGKEYDRDGTMVHAGITPTISVGSTDLHSMGQLYLGGPRDKVTTFVYSAQTSGTVSVPRTLVFPYLVEHIAGTLFSDIMAAIREGVKAAYAKGALPFMEVVLHDISEQSLGAFFQFKMLEVMYLGELLHINAFDQPNVEAYKTETKRILAQT